MMKKWIIGIWTRIDFFICIEFTLYNCINFIFADSQIVYKADETIFKNHFTHLFIYIAPLHAININIFCKVAGLSKQMICTI